MRFRKFAALLEINTATLLRGSWAANKVGKIIDAYAPSTYFDESKTQDLHDVIEYAFQSVKDPKDGTLESFYIGMLKHDLPEAMNDKVFKFLLEDAHPYEARLNLARFSQSTKNPLLAERAMDAILKLESDKNLGNAASIDCLGKVLVLNDTLAIKKKALEKLCAIGSKEAYRQAIDGIHAISFYDESSKDQEYLIDSIIQSKAEDKLSLLLKCQSQGVVAGSVNRRKVFAAFCELSKTEDDDVTASAREAAEAAAKMFYETQDGEYLNMGDLAQVLLGVSQRNLSPASMKPFFAAVSNPENGLGRFIVAKFSIASTQRKPLSVATPNLGAVFGAIDAGNAQKGYETPLKDIYMGLCSAIASENKSIRKRAAAFDLDK